MARVYNFSAGPAVLPEEVLRQAAAEMLDYDGTGMSVMEMSHRSKPFASIIETAEADLRELLQIPDNYQVLFLQGGATQQFAAIPMNLMQNKKADYIVSGSWSKKAWKEAKLYGEARCVASSEDENFSYVPDVAGLEFDPEADYVYICQNETIYGTTYHALPETGDIPLVTDVSSSSCATTWCARMCCPSRPPSCATPPRRRRSRCRTPRRPTASTSAASCSSG